MPGTGGALVSWEQDRSSSQSRRSPGPWDTVRRSAPRAQPPCSRRLRQDSRHRPDPLSSSRRTLPAVRLRGRWGGSLRARHCRSLKRACGRPPRRTPRLSETADGMLPGHGAPGHVYTRKRSGVEQELERLRENDQCTLYAKTNPDRLKRTAAQGDREGELATGKGGQFSSDTQSCPTLCNPMDRSTPGLPVHHQLPELAQTHVHQVGDKQE